MKSENLNPGEPKALFRCVQRLPAHVEKNGQRSLAIGLRGFRKAKPVRVGHPSGCGKEYLTEILSFRNQHPVKADIVYDDAVREIIDGESDDVVKTAPFHFQPGRNRLSRSEGDFERRICDGAFDKICLRLVIRFERNK